MEKDNKDKEKKKEREERLRSATGHRCQQSDTNVLVKKL